MKIWLINQYNMPPEYGHLNRHFNIGKYLKRMGHAPTVFVGSFLHNTKIQTIEDDSLIKRYKNANYPYYFIRTCDYSSSKLKRIYAMYEFYKNMLKSVKSLDKPDVILGSSAHPLAAFAAIRLGKKYGCQSIVEVRDLWPESFVAYNILSKKNPILKLLYSGEKWIYKKADKLIFTMEGGKDYIIQKGWDFENGGPINISKVHHVNNGVDLDNYKYNLHNNTLEDSDLEDSSYKIVYTGSLRKTNDSIWVLLKAAKILHQNSKIVKILIYGDGSEKSKFIKYCKDNLLSNVYFKGFIDKKYIPYVLSKADLNILNCSSWSVLNYGGSQNKLFEYLASGKPIISGEDSKYSIIKRNGCGISRSIEGPEDLYKIILNMMNLSSASREKMSKASLRASKDYDYQNLAKKLIEIIES